MHVDVKGDHKPLIILQLTDENIYNLVNVESVRNSLLFDGNSEGKFVCLIIQIESN